MTRIAGEMGAKDQHLLHVTEFLHPRAEELVSLLPARMGARWAANPRRMALVDRLFNKGRRLRSDTLARFPDAAPDRRASKAGARNPCATRPRWRIWNTGSPPPWLPAGNYDLAVEVIRCRRLIKGYSDTHARGLSKFDKVLAAIALVKDRDDAADWARRLREAALEGRRGQGA
jgi:indolepyruvate ferredoxin oxidoreductase beta subunit